MCYHFFNILHERLFGAFKFCFCFFYLSELKIDFSTQNFKDIKAGDLRSAGRCCFVSYRPKRNKQLLINADKYAFFKKTFMSEVSLNDEMTASIILHRW